MIQCACQLWTISSGVANIFSIYFCENVPNRERVRLFPRRFSKKRNMWTIFVKIYTKWLNFLKCVKVEKTRIFFPTLVASLYDGVLVLINRIRFAPGKLTLTANCCKRLIAILKKGNMYYKFSVIKLRIIILFDISIETLRY
jgi:hypothetical protein